MYHYQDYFDLEQFIVLGHSFTRHASRYIYRHRSYKDLQLRHAEVHFEGHTGVKHNKILFVEDVEEWIRQFPLSVKYASVIALEISSNDLQENYYNRPQALAEKVFEIAERLRHMGTTRVVIMQCLYRQGLAAIPRWETDLSRRSRRRCMDHYNQTVRTYNSIIKFKCRHHDGTIVFRKQYGLKQNWKFLLRDGVHIRYSAIPKYLENLRSCFIAQGIKCRHA